MNARLLMTLMLAVHVGAPLTFAGPGDRVLENRLAPPHGDVRALLVGVEDYATYHDMPPLSFTIDDATSLAEVLREHYGYHTTLLTDPTAEQLLQAIDAEAAALQPSDVFIFFFAGHGHTTEGVTGDRTGYFIPRAASDLNALTIADVRPALLQHTPFTPPPRIEPHGDQPGQSDEEYQNAIERARAAWELARIHQEQDRRLIEYSIRMDLLRDRLANVRAKHVVAIFDACFAGLATRSTHAAPAEAIVDDAALIRHYRLLNEPSRFVFTAGTGGETAVEHDAATRGYDQIYRNRPLPGASGITHGVFTYELIGALGDVPQTGRTLTALREEVATRVETVMAHIPGDNTMTPQLRPTGEIGGEFVFIPSPFSHWLTKAGDAITRAHANMQGEGANRGAVEAVLALDVANDRQRLREDRLLSRAMVVLAYAAGARHADGALANDPIWQERARLVTSRASLGDPDAMAALFYIYCKGLGVAPDPQRAAHWAAEAAASDSADARQAWATALEEGIGMDGTAISEVDRQRKAEEAEARAAQQKTAAVAAAGAVLAVGADQGEVGAVLGLTAAGLMAHSLRESKPDSIESNIAALAGDIEVIRALIDDLQRTGVCDRAAFDKARASINERRNAIVQQARRGNRGAVGKEHLDTLIGRSATELVAATQEVMTPLNRGKADHARLAFADVEIAYAKLVALMPYHLYHVSWE